MCRGSRTPIWDQVFTMTSVTNGFQFCRARIRSRRGMSVSRASLPAESGGAITQISPKACCARLQKRYDARHNKYKQYLSNSDHGAFDLLYRPEGIAPNSGIYRCEGCEA